jgi:hypothetical protein
MNILTIVSTNRNLFINLHNNGELLYKSSLGLLKLTKRDIKILNNLKQVISDLVECLIEKQIK